MSRWRVLAGVAIWLTLWLALAATGAHPSGLAIGGIVAVAVAIFAVGSDLFSSAGTTTWARRRPVGSFARRNDPRVSALRRQVTGSPWRGADELNGTLIDLIDDRLAAHHDVERAADPQAAIAILPPSLQQLLASPDRPISGARELRRIVDDIEGL